MTASDSDTATRQQQNDASIFIHPRAGDSDNDNTEQAFAIAVTDDTEDNVVKTIDLATLDVTNGFTLNGIDGRDASGYSVSSAGDVNGDGYDDLIIGACGADQNEALNAGETYVVYGGTSAPGTDGVLALSALDGMDGLYPHRD